MLVLVRIGCVKSRNITEQVTHVAPRSYLTIQNLAVAAATVAPKNMRAAIFEFKRGADCAN